VVVGLGRSGAAAALLCAQRGATVTGTDVRTREALGETAGLLTSHGVSLALGGHDAVDWDAAELVVVSPGVPSFPALQQVERSGREVIGEMELASRFMRAPIALIGGTNGKSTVTSWLGAMMSQGRRKVFTGGNLGVPPAEAIDEPMDLWVLEISSFQAERIPTLHARCAALLNITDDHLDRYADLQAYADAKGNMFVGMRAEDAAVIPAGDAQCLRQAERGGARLITFGPQGEVSVQGGELLDRAHGMRFDTSAIRLSGQHNLMNACAAVAMAAELGATEAEIGAALESFEGLSHRTAFVAEIDGVRFYNDSKGTNVGASVAALRGLREPKAVLIAGGRDKLGSYEPLVEALAERGRALVVIGEAADRISEAAAGRVQTVRAASMQQAVQQAFALAERGDAVLLSPACASFDMFRDYTERGRVFVQSVQALAARPSGSTP
jgi:UDP-N-acetylmuramoylalanine--D-glutamate ligase